MPDERQGSVGIAGGFLFFTVLGLASPFFALHAHGLGASTAAIGAMVTLRAILPVFIAMPAGQLIDRIGPVRMLRAGLVALFASLLMVATARGLWMLALSQVLLGAGIVIGASSLQVLVAVGEGERRREAIKRYAMWMSAGSTLGPLLGGGVVALFDAPSDGYRAAFALSAMATIGFLAVLLRLRPADDAAAPAALWPTLRAALGPQGVLDSYRSGAALTRHAGVRFGLSATFVIMYIQSMYASFLPLFMHEAGFGTLLISATLSAKNAAGMASRLLLGHLMARVRPEAILMGAGAVAAAGVMMTPLAASSSFALLLVVLIVGAAVGLNLPVSIMVMVEATGEGERGRLMGLRLLVNRLSQIASPLVFGGVAAVLGLGTGFGVAGCLLTAAILGFGLHHHGAAAAVPVPPQPASAPPVDEAKAA